MLIVTGYPIGYAFYLSLQKFDLRFPDDKEFVGLSNYVDVLTSSTWWTDVGNTLLITVISVAIELVLGMAIALVMHRAIFGRGPVRAAILIPYGIVTVVAAFAWRYAFDPTSGFVQSTFLLGDDAAPLTDRGGSLVVIILDRGLEDHAVHGAAAAGRPGARARRAARGGEGGRRQRRPALLPHHAAADEAGDPGRAAVPHARRLPALRLGVHPQPGGANGTETVSILGYNVLINRVNLGLGSAISVLIFIAVILIAVFFVKVLGTSTAQQRGEET